MNAILNGKEAGKDGMDNGQTPGTSVGLNICCIWHFLLKTYHSNQKILVAKV